jgi:hypothetical protein
VHILRGPDLVGFLPEHDHVLSAPLGERNIHGTPMSETGTVEECVDDIDDFVATLESYPPDVLVVALRAHLAGLLRVLRERGDWSDSQMGEFLRDFSSEVLDSGGE